MSDIEVETFSSYLMGVDETVKKDTVVKLEDYLSLKQEHDAALERNEYFKAEILRLSTELVDRLDERDDAVRAAKYEADVAEQALAEVKALKAQVEQLREQLEYFVSGSFEFNEGSEYIANDIQELLDKTPAQCLAEHDAEIARKARFDLAESIGANIGAGATMDEVVEMILCELRQQARP